MTCSTAIVARRARGLVCALPAAAAADTGLSQTPSCPAWSYDQVNAIGVILPGRHHRALVLVLFDKLGYPFGMSGNPNLRPASADEIAEALSFALRYEGRKRVNHADTMMARITADRLVRHLERSGFVLMKRPPGQAPTTAIMPPGQAPETSR